MRGPEPSVSRVTVACTCRLSGGLPPSVSPCARAIEKHDACAAAISSSGLVLPSERSVRDAQVTGRSPVAPLVKLRVPAPWARSPSHVVLAVRCADMALTLPRDGGSHTRPGATSPVS